jgi:hypothetical protein
LSTGLSFGKRLWYNVRRSYFFPHFKENSMPYRMIASFVCCWILFAVSAFGQTALFEKKNLADWDFYAVQAEVKVEDVFSFTDDGRLLCTGQPFGYLATKETYKNFKFAIEWRWTEGKEPTNSGIFLKIGEQPKDTFLPQTVEVQLQHQNAGDLWGFHGRELAGPADRFVARDGNATTGKTKGVRKLLGAEKEPGQWNAMEILCADGLIVVVINGKIVNWATGAETIAGRIGLQSEGGPVEFRNALLTTLP